MCMKKLIFVLMVLSIPALASAGTTLYDSQGFEGPLYNLGLLTGQDLWVTDSTAGQPDPQVINDPTGAGMGQVVEIDALPDVGGWAGACRPAGPSLPGTVVIEWDQYRASTFDNFWYADDVAWSGWWAMQWDQNSQASAQVYDFGVPLTVNQWQHVIYTFDTIAQTVSVDIDGIVFTSPNAMTDPTIDGIDLEGESTTFDGDNGPILVDNMRITETPIPEPGVLLLAGLGLLALLRRKK